MENLKITNNLDIDTNKNVFIPSGVLVPIAGSSTSDIDGFLFCDGRSLLRTDYPSLFSAIGTTWGAVDSTHFNIPNFYSYTDGSRYYRRFISMPPAGTNISNTISRSNHSHGNTSISNSTGNLAYATFDHSGHDGNFDVAVGGTHNNYYGASYANANAAAGNDNAKAGNTSPVAINQHTHGLMYIHATSLADTSNNRGSHSHTFGYGVGSSSGTNHSHTYDTTVESVSGIMVEPEYKTALYFIKI